MRMNLDHHKYIYLPYMPGTYNVIYYSTDLKMERLILCLAADGLDIKKMSSINKGIVIFGWVAQRNRG